MKFPQRAHTASRMVKVLIFDFGGVITNSEKTVSMPQSLSILFKISIEDAMLLWSKNKENLLLGKESPRDFLQRVSPQTQPGRSAKRLLEEWKKLVRKDKESINWAVVSCMEELKRKFKVYILSDASSINDDELTEEIISKFDGYFVSHEEGFRKTKPEAYLNLLKKINARPKECIFIDDIQSIVDVALSLGIKSLKFTTLEDLKQSLNLYLVR